MIYIIEGTDGTGKTVLVERIREKSRKIRGVPPVILHADAPTHTNWADEYVRPLTLTQHEHPGADIICDRWHLGELVWPALFGRPGLFPNDEDFYSCQRAIDALGRALRPQLVICFRDEPSIIKCLADRGEPLRDIDRSLAGQRAYFRAIAALETELHRWQPARTDEVVPMINSEYPSQAAHSAFVLAKENGVKRDSRNGPMREVLDVELKILRPDFIPMCLPGRSLSSRLQALEAVQLVAGMSVPDRLVKAIPKMEEYRDDGLHFHGAYGPRIATQMVGLLERLNDPNSRQAVLTIYDGNRDLGVERKDLPCTLTIQFLARDDLLRCRVSMRSSDAYLGIPYDLMQFATLQLAVAAALELEVGPLLLTTGSLHVYEADVDKLFSYGDVYVPAGFGIDPFGFCRRLLQRIPPAREMTDFEDWLQELTR